MKVRIMLLMAAFAVSAIGGASLENEDKAYGELYGQIVESKFAGKFAGTGPAKPL